MNLRQRLDEGVTLTELAATTPEVEEVAVSERKAAVRETFDLPDPLPDRGAEGVLDTALDAAATGDIEDAAATLSAAFVTVCERREPSLEQTRVGHLAACHLHD
ncbi:MAG: hypothetical protein ACQETI_08970 [Halobacteriota archaeon]